MRFASVLLPTLLLSTAAAADIECVAGGGLMRSADAVVSLGASEQNVAHVAAGVSGASVRPSTAAAVDPVADQVDSLFVQGQLRYRDGTLTAVSTPASAESRGAEVHYGLFHLTSSTCNLVGPHGSSYAPSCSTFSGLDGYEGNNAVDVLLTVDAPSSDTYRGPLQVQATVVGDVEDVVCHPLGRSTERDVVVRCSGHSSPSVLGTYYLSVVITSHLYSATPSGSDMDCVDETAASMVHTSAPGRVEVDAQDQVDWNDPSDYLFRFSETSDVGSAHTEGTISTISEALDVKCDSNYRWVHLQRTTCIAPKWSVPLDMFPFLHGSTIAAAPTSGAYTSSVEEVIEVLAAVVAAGVAVSDPISSLESGDLTLTHSGAGDGQAPVYENDDGLCFTSGMVFGADTVMSVTADMASSVVVRTVFVVAEVRSAFPFSLFASSAADTSFRQTGSGLNAIADYQVAKMDRVRINGLIVSGSTVAPIDMERAVYVFEDIDSYVAKFGDADGATGSGEGFEGVVYELEFHNTRLSDADIRQKTLQLASKYRIPLIPQPEFDVLGSLDAFAEPATACVAADSAAHVSSQGLSVTANLRAWFDAAAHDGSKTAAQTRRATGDDELEDAFTVILCDLSGEENHGFTPPPYSFDDGQSAGWSEGHRPLYVVPTEGIYFPDDVSDGAGNSRILLTNDIDDARTLVFVAQWWGSSAGEGTLFGRAVRSKLAPGSGANELFASDADIAAVYVNGVQQTLAAAMRPTSDLAVITVVLNSDSLVNQLSAGFGDGWIGRIAEVLIYGSTLTELERLTVEGYLSAKWL